MTGSFMELLRFPIATYSFTQSEDDDSDTCNAFINFIHMPQNETVDFSESGKDEIFLALMNHTMCTVNDIMNTNNPTPEELNDTIVGFVIEFESVDSIMDAVQYALEYEDIMELAIECFEENGYHEVKDIIFEKGGKIYPQAFIWENTTAGKTIIEMNKSREEQLNSKSGTKKLLNMLNAYMKQHNGGDGLWN